MNSFKKGIILQFDKICEDGGFKKDVPKELVQAFNEKVKEVELFVSNKKKEANEKLFREVKETEEEKKENLKRKNENLKKEREKLN